MNTFPDAISSLTSDCGPYIARVGTGAHGVASAVKAGLGGATARGCGKDRNASLVYPPARDVVFPPLRVGPQTSFCFVDFPAVCHTACSVCRRDEACAKMPSGHRIPLACQLSAIVPESGCPALRRPPSDRAPPAHLAAATFGATWPPSLGDRRRPACRCLMCTSCWHKRMP